MVKERKRLLRFKSKKVNRMLDMTAFYWLVAFTIFYFLRFSKDFATDKPSELSLVLKEYNPLFACLPVAFAVLFIVKLIELFLIRIRFREVVPKEKSVLSWLIKHFHISYQADQLALKDETILLAWQFLFCVVGFFIELKWYLVGALGMVFYLCMYIALSFQELKNFFKKSNL